MKMKNFSSYFSFALKRFSIPPSPHHGVVLATAMAAGTALSVVLCLQKQPIITGVQHQDFDSLQEMTHACLKFGRGEEWCKERLKNLVKRKEKGGVIACEETLKEVGQWNRYKNFVVPHWEKVFSQTKVSVREFTLEFLSTFRFREQTDPWKEDAVTYRLNGKWYGTNIARFGVDLGIFTEEEYENRMIEVGNPDHIFPVEGEKQRKAGAMRKAFWQEISFGTRYNASTSKSTQIRDPLLRYIHRLLSHGVTARGQSGGVVNLRELWILYCIVHKHPCDIAHLLAQHIERNAVADLSTPILVGGWVARIYEDAEIDPSGTTPGVGPSYLDLNICNHMGILHELPSGDYRFKDKDGQVWDPNDPREIMMEIEYPTGDGDHGAGGSGYGGRHDDDDDDDKPPVQGPEFPSMLDLYHAIGRVEQRTVDMHGHTANRIGDLSERVDSLATEFTGYRTVWEERWRQDHPS